jgi:hypothetical protein
MLYTFPPGRQCLQSLHHPPSLSSLWHLNSVAKVSLSQLPWNIIAWQHLVLKMTQKAGKSGSTPHSDHSGPQFAMTKMSKAGSWKDGAIASCTTNTCEPESAIGGHQRRCCMVKLPQHEILNVWILLNHQQINDEHCEHT